MEQVKKITYQGNNAIALIGHITAQNAPEVEAAIREILAADTFAEVILDAKNLDYISSAGLRILLRLMKSGKKVRLVNVSSEVYEILEITGFTEMLPVAKGFRQVSIEGCEVIGQGSNGVVYRLDPETIVKVYRNSDALDEMQREREISRKAFVLGIPTAIPYDVVQVGEKYGTVFELLNARSISKSILAEPEKMEEYARIFTDVVKNIHATTVKPGEFPSMKAVALNWADYLKDYLSPQHYEKLHALIAEVPESNQLLHGDYHSNNVMIQNGEPLMIDMDTLCVGHPVFELASTFNAYVGFGKIDPEESAAFLKIDHQSAVKFWDTFLAMYLDSTDEAYIQSVAEKAMIIGYTRLLRRTIRRNSVTEKGKICIAFYKATLEDLLSRVDTLLF